MMDFEELVARLRHPAGPWARVDVLEQVDSTNALAGADPSPWRIIVAAEQTAGRGRQGRSWASPPGTSVSMSMVVPLPTGGADLGWVPLLAGLAVVRGLGELTGRPEAFGLKWPNDVLAEPLDVGQRPGHGKICGILCQVAGPTVVVGIGLNVSAPPDSLPAAHPPPGRAAPIRAVSLAQCMPAVPRREDVALAVAQAFAQGYERFTSGPEALRRLRADYAAACLTVGRVVDIVLPGGVQGVGTAEFVDGDGRLVVREADSGRVTAYAAGDVFHIRPRNSA